MKVNNVVITKPNLQEMVKDWETELTRAIQMVDCNPRYTEAHDAGVNKLKNLRSRMLNVITG